MTLTFTLIQLWPLVHHGSLQAVDTNNRQSNHTISIHVLESCIQCALTHLQASLLSQQRKKSEGRLYDDCLLLFVCVETRQASLPTRKRRRQRRFERCGKIWTEPVRSWSRREKLSPVWRVLRSWKEKMWVDSVHYVCVCVCVCVLVCVRMRVCHYGQQMQPVVPFSTLSIPGVASSTVISVWCCQCKQQLSMSFWCCQLRQQWSTSFWCC